MMQQKQKRRSTTTTTKRSSVVALSVIVSRDVSSAVVLGSLVQAVGLVVLVLVIEVMVEEQG